MRTSKPSCNWEARCYAEPLGFLGKHVGSGSGTCDIRHLFKLHFMSQNSLVKIVIFIYGEISALRSSGERNHVGKLEEHASWPHSNHVGQLRSFRTSIHWVPK
jgi:hypothetical protein